MLARLKNTDNATFDKTITIGLGHYSVNRYVLVEPEEGYDMEYRFSFGDEKCIPFYITAQKFASDAKVMAPSPGEELYSFVRLVPVPYVVSRRLSTQCRDR